MIDLVMLGLPRPLSDQELQPCGAGVPCLRVRAQPAYPDPGTVARRACVRAPQARPRTDRGRPPVARRGAGRGARPGQPAPVDPRARRRRPAAHPFLRPAHPLLGVFPHWIPRLQADFRSAKFSVDCDYLPQCLSRLRDGSVDYVVALLDEGEAVSRRLGIDSEAEFQRLELGHEQLVAVCAPDAAGQPLFNLDRLQTEALSFLGYPRNATWAGPWSRCCATAACSSSAITAPARPRGCASSPSRVWASPGCRIPWSARTSPAVAWCAPAASASTCRCATP